MRILAALLIFTYSATAQDGDRLVMSQQYVIPSGGTVSDSKKQDAISNLVPPGNSSDPWNWYFVASAFVASNTFTLHTIKLSTYTNGAALTGTVGLKVYTDNSGSPGTMVTGGAVTNNTSTAVTTNSLWIFDGYACQLTSGTMYWLVAQQSTYQASSTRLVYCLRRPTYNAPYTNTLRGDTLPLSTEFNNNAMFCWELWGQ